MDTIQLRKTWQNSHTHSRLQPSGTMKLVSHAGLAAGVLVAMGCLSMNMYLRYTANVDTDTDAASTFHLPFGGLLRPVTGSSHGDGHSPLLRDVGAVVSAPAGTVDASYDSFTGCTAAARAGQPSALWTFTENALAGEKSCTLTTTPTGMTQGAAWGPVSSYNWNGDFGYWFDGVGVRARGAGGVLQGRGVACSWLRRLSGYVLLRASVL